MIKINLLDYRKERIRIKIQMQIFTSLLLVFSALGLSGFISSLQGKEISDLQGKINKKNQELASLRHIEIKVAESEKMQKRLESIVETIKNLKVNQKEPAKLYDEMLNKRIPVGKMWIERLNEKEGTIVLIGYAFDNNTISVYMESLQQMGVFSSVNLEFTRQKTISKRKVKGFKIICLISKDGMAALGHLARTKHGTPGSGGGVSKEGGPMGNVFSREAAQQYSQRLADDVKQKSGNPFVDARNRIRQKKEEEANKK